MGRRARATAAGAAGAADDTQQQTSNKRQRVKKVEQQPEPAAVQALHDQAKSAASEKAAAAKEGKAAAKKPSKNRAAAAGAAKVPAAAAAAAAADAGPSGPSGPPKQQFFLVKSEPDAFSIDQLEARPNQTEGWDGVRNAQARNNMRGMRLGDLAFFYHSSCKVPGIVGIAKVVREAYPDVTAFDPSSQYYDASSSKENPKWWQVDIQLVRRLCRQITLEELKSHKDGSLTGMALFNRPRLSVQQVTADEWQFVLGLEDQEPPAAAAAAAKVKTASGRAKKSKKDSRAKQEDSS